MPRLRQMAEEATRDPQSLAVTLGGAPGSGTGLASIRLRSGTREAH